MLTMKACLISLYVILSCTYYTSYGRMSHVQRNTQGVPMKQSVELPDRSCCETGLCCDKGHICCQGVCYDEWCQCCRHGCYNIRGQCCNRGGICPRSSPTCCTSVDGEEWWCCAEDQQCCPHIRGCCPTGTLCSDKSCRGEVTDYKHTRVEGIKFAGHVSRDEL